VPNQKSEFVERLPACIVPTQSCKIMHDGDDLGVYFLSVCSRKIKSETTHRYSSEGHFMDMRHIELGVEECKVQEDSH
jgi:hypothetical protein